MREYRDSFAEMRQNVPLEDVIRSYGLNLTSAGTMRCPFHNDRTPSFKVYPDNHYHCFGCQAHGSVIDFVMQYEGIGFSEAVNKLAEAYHLDIGCSRRHSRTDFIAMAFRTAKKFRQAKDEAHRAEQLRIANEKFRDAWALVSSYDGEEITDELVEALLILEADERREENGGEGNE